MLDINNSFEVNGEVYPLVADMVALEQIQNKYGTIDAWSNLISGAEPNLEAVIFGIGEFINEGIDIENEKAEKPRALLTHKQVGRVITQLGLSKAAEKIKETIIESTKDTNPKNA